MSAMSSNVEGEAGNFLTAAARDRLRSLCTKSDVAGRANFAVADLLGLLAELDAVEHRLGFVLQRQGAVRQPVGTDAWVCYYVNAITGRREFAFGTSSVGALDAAMRISARSAAIEVNRPHNAAMRECQLEELDIAR